MASIIRLFLHTTSRLAFIWVAVLLMAVMAKTNHKPNIVLILTDDLDISIGGMVRLWLLFFSYFHLNRANRGVGACVRPESLLFMFPDSLKQNKEADWRCWNYLPEHGKAQASKFPQHTQLHTSNMQWSVELRLSRDSAED